jgi:hypothetical protein
VTKPANPFSRVALFVLPAAVAISVVIAIALTLLSDPAQKKVSAGADGYSQSAIGHHALIGLLRQLGIPVVVSRGHSGEKAKHGLLLVAEPRIGNDAAAASKLETLIRSAPRTLLVLPKWYGFAKPGAAWIERAAAVPTDEVERVLGTVVGDGEVERGAVDGWRTEEGLGVPALANAQTIGSETSLEALVEDGRGMLVGTRDLVDGQVWVLADPDVLNNAGLGRADNARFIVSLIDRLREGGPVIVDETIHGYQQSTSLARLLFKFPLVLATTQMMLCVLVAMWAALVRFGPRRAPRPPLAPGKEYLIRNTATLLQFGGHHAEALQRYFAATVQQVRHALNAPPGLSHTALVEWLERIRVVRAGTVALPGLEAAVQRRDTPPQGVLELANTIHRWRMEMMNERGNRT